ncbi:ABC transporter substrate-binding protein [Methylobacterium nodulans]|uniref:Extracellular solute-binding protein family 3 n=1 Tax=Methylobacterium nodulans (strain LMG 21967 / CNCM I-2342 / ORS 2060) TaxID=460265 RepID=B8IGL3_METNO|nr:ABC transporter substrate-binding protein [Methylobacterium nodulans]ACL55913.1 extracellular solute-binding protein family 3 [Methylobacterium nodulans ORS 2060]
MKTLTLSLVALLSLGAVSARADQLDDIKKRGTLVCATLGTTEPFSFQDLTTRQTAGYDVDFCKAIADALGVKLELKLVAVEARIPELSQGRVDVVAANLGYTPERAEQIDYSDFYYVSQQKLLARDAEGFKAASDLGGKRVSAIKGSTSELAVKNSIPSAQTVTFQDAPAAFLAMQQRKVAAFAASEIMLVKFRSQAGTGLEILEPSLMREPWGIGVRKGEKSLLAAVNKALLDLEASGKAAAIFTKWLGADSPYHLTREFKIEPRS